MLSRPTQVLILSRLHWYSLAARSKSSTYAYSDLYADVRQSALISYKAAPVEDSRRVLLCASAQPMLVYVAELPAAPTANTTRLHSHNLLCCMQRPFAVCSRSVQPRCKLVVCKAVWAVWPTEG